MLVAAICVAGSEAVVIFLFLAQGHRVDYGDVPTWLAVAAALGAGWVALRAFRGQQKEFVRQVRQLERQQADAIDLTGWEEGAVACVPSPTTLLPQPKAILAIENKSLRPVRQVRCRLWPQGDERCVRPLTQRGRWIALVRQSSASLPSARDYCSPASPGSMAWLPVRRARQGWDEVCRPLR